MSFPSITLIVGAFFLIVGLVVIFKTQYGEVSATGRFARVILAVLGVVLMAVSVITYSYERASQTQPPAPPAPQPGAPALSLQPSDPGREAGAGPDAPASKADPEKLIAVIKREQEAEVGTSYDQYDNFSDDDLAEFKRRRKAEAVAARLEKDGEFLDLVAAIRRLDMTARQKLLDRAAGTYKATWRQMKKISPEGQTEAGQAAEKMIAAAVVGKVKELLQKPDAELRKLSL